MRHFTQTNCFDLRLDGPLLLPREICTADIKTHLDWISLCVHKCGAPYVYSEQSTGFRGRDVGIIYLFLCSFFGTQFCNLNNIKRVKSRKKQKLETK